MKKILIKLIPLFCIVPFIMGGIGYSLTGEEISNALYASFALYFTNPVSDAYNFFIEFARWTAPLATATAILYAIRNIWRKITDFFKCLRKDSVAIYSDDNTLIEFPSSASPIYAKREFKKCAKSHIIMLDTDTESLEFYENNKEILKKKKVYIALKEMEYGLVKDEDDAIFYDINGAIARTLWKTIALWKKGKEKLNISIVGDGALSHNILNHGLLLNLFSVNQEITYNLISNSDTYKLRHDDMPLGNRDTINYYSPADNNAWDILEKSDITIIADILSEEFFQTVCVSAKNGEIYFYSPNSGTVGNFLNLSNMFPFGQNKLIYTDENIRQGKLIEKAINQNLKYATTFGGETDWNKLSEFTKWSNISSSDFGEIIRNVYDNSPESFDIEVFSELEHIRWSRFHYINYWTYGIPENGKSKDPEKRIHLCLVDYDKLTEIDKEKDRDVIREIIK